MVLSKKEIMVVRTSSQDKLSFLREHFYTLPTTQFLQEDVFNVIFLFENYQLLDFVVQFLSLQPANSFFTMSVAACFRDLIIIKIPSDMEITLCYTLPKQ